jgi:hypothetical protein
MSNVEFCRKNRWCSNISCYPGETNHVFLLSGLDSKLLPPDNESDVECVFLDVETNSYTDHTDQLELNDNLQINKYLYHQPASTYSAIKTLLNFQA